jgi:2-polyprenyl-6-methoxyphenol hydroxylase-like FAD-dependent oxidoreductase
VASGVPPARHVRFDVGPAVLEGHFPTFQGVDAVYSPRRTVLDGLLVEAARAAGAEVRERFIVEELVVEGGRVTGIRGREKGGAPVAESARLTVGADGKHSLVARTVGAASHHDRPPLTVACYTYWDGVPLQGGELYARPRRAVGAWPTNDGLTLVAVEQNARAAFENSLFKLRDYGEDKEVKDDKYREVESDFADIISVKLHDFSLGDPELAGPLRAALLRSRFAAKVAIELEDHVSVLVVGRETPPGGIANREFGVAAYELLDEETPAWGEIGDEELERLAATMWGCNFEGAD